MNTAFLDLTVPIDASATAVRGIGAALDVAVPGACLHFCSVVPTANALAAGAAGFPYDPTPLLEAAEEDARRVCDEAVATARWHGFEADAELLRGDIVPAIQRHTAATHSTGLVIGTHARAGARRVLMGSVAEDLMRSSDVPVVVAHLDDRTPERGPIGVAYDGSPAARTALDVGAEFARRRGRTLIVITAVEGDDEAWRATEGMLEDAATALRAKPVDFELVTMRGSTVETVVRAVERLNCSLLAVGTRGYAGAKRLLFGSVAAALVERARLPVLVVRAADAD